MRKPLTKRWSDGDIAELRQLYSRQLPLWRIAARLRRPQKSVRGKLQELRCSVNRPSLSEGGVLTTHDTTPENSDPR